jgi:hypothetical protein
MAWGIEQDYITLILGYEFEAREWIDMVSTSKAVTAATNVRQS